MSLEKRQSPGQHNIIFYKRRIHALRRLYFTNTFTRTIKPRETAFDFSRLILLLFCWKTYRSRGTRSITAHVRRRRRRWRRHRPSRKLSYSVRWASAFLPRPRADPAGQTNADGLRWHVERKKIKPKQNN